MTWTQGEVITASIVLAFLVFITARGELQTYIQLLV